ncbi:MAG: restriction endonuclease [Fibrobacter sp.]|nr:restriction endonuclease [Fibrobacter sp.]
MKIDSKYFKDYRKSLGFTSQKATKDFFAAKDIKAPIDYAYIEALNQRLCDITIKTNDLVSDEIKDDNINSFCAQNILEVFNKLREHEIIPRLNNQGRRPEHVYFSWMRGYVISTFFLKALSYFFEVDIDTIELIGDDDLESIATFRRTPKADMQVKLNDGEVLRVEVQSGFQGVNDIKQHKVLEAKSVKKSNGLSSLVVHFDLYNGQVAFVSLNDIDDDSINWITRQQMEGQTVFNIAQNYFRWKLTEKPPKFSEIRMDL